MARIFYFSASGDVYGVHPGLHEANPKIRLPAGVIWADVPETPDSIPWPIPADHEKGREEWSRMNSVSKSLELRRNIVIPPADPNAVLKSKIDAVVAEELLPQKIKDVFMEWKTKL